MTFRISDAGLEALAALELVYSLNRSEIARQMIAYGLRHTDLVLGSPKQGESGAA